jgi:hypothetical protein
MTPYKEKSTCRRRSSMAERNVLAQKIIVEQMEKGNGELSKFVINSKI